MEKYSRIIKAWNKLRFALFHIIVTLMIFWLFSKVLVYCENSITQKSKNEFISKVDAFFDDSDVIGFTLCTDKNGNLFELSEDDDQSDDESFFMMNSTNDTTYHLFMFYRKEKGYVVLGNLIPIDLSDINSNKRTEAIDDSDEGIAKIYEEASTFKKFKEVSSFCYRWIDAGFSDNAPSTRIRFLDARDSVPRYAFEMKPKLGYSAALDQDKIEITMFSLSVLAMVLSVIIAYLVLKRIDL